jgi:signal transduction histidine kinase
MEAGAHQAAALLDSLLQCARLDWLDDPVKPSTFNLNEALSAVISATRTGAAGKNLELKLECPATLSIHTDKQKLERIVANLLTNAIKFTKQGVVRAAVETGSKGIEIHIIDTGPGIPPEHQPHVFDDFYQVQNPERDHTKGFGLGLSIARRMARQLGGDIALESAPGAGSRFTILLPANGL